MNQLDPEKQQIFYLIKKDKDYEDYFFTKVKSLEWFDILQDAGYFNPENIKFDENGNTFFWNVLYYLEKVSILVKDGESEKYGKRLVEIIHDVVLHSQQKRKIDHYHIWWFLVKILINLPTRVIAENVTLEKFRLWMFEWTDSKFGDDLVVHDIPERLLGKLLEEDRTIIFAEEIIARITEIKTAKKSKTKFEIFTDRQDARMFWSPYWILHGFKKHHEQIGQKCSINVIYGLAEKLKRALEYKQAHHYVVLRMANEAYQIKVERIRRKGLEEEDVGFEEWEFIGSIKQYGPDQLKELDLDKDFWALHKTEPSIGIGEDFEFKAETKDQFVTEITKQLPDTVKWEDADDYEKKLPALYDGLNEDYSHVWIRSLSDKKDSHLDDAQGVLTVLLIDVLLAKSKNDTEGTLQILNSFLEAKYQFPLFRRIILFVIKCNDWSKYGNLFPATLDNWPDVFKGSDYEVELHDLLLTHNDKFDNNLITKIKKMLENVPEYYLQEGDAAAAYWKYKWLSPLKDNPSFSNDYNEQKSKAQLKEDKEYEPHRSTVQTGWERHKSPLSSGEIIAMKNVDLVKYFKEYQGADFWGAFEGRPDRDGLGEALQTASKENPEKFVSDMDVFNQQGIYFYVNRMLWGLRDAWRDGKDINWGNVLEFAMKYISRSTFMDDAIKDQGEDSGKFRGKYVYAIEVIADLIEDGSRDDNRAFDDKYIPKAEELYLCLLQHVKGEKRPDTQRDTVTYAINTTLGKVIESYIIFSLHVARKEGKKEEERESGWGKDKYEKFFEMGIEAHIFFGRYLPNLKYLDREWVAEKIEQMNLMLVSDPEWQAFMESYLTGPNIYKPVYDLMRVNYKKGLDVKIFDEKIDYRLVQHITMGYLRSYEQLKEKNSEEQESLFWQLLNSSLEEKKEDRLPEIVSFMWSVIGKKEDTRKEKALDQGIKDRMISFWRWIVEMDQNELKSKLSDHYESLLCKLAELTVILDEIDEEKEKWIMLSAPFVDKHHFVTFFVEYLASFQDANSIKRVGRIYLKVLDHTTPIYKNEDIEKIVDNLFKGDEEDKRNARSICNIYGRRGQHFLQELYYSNNG